MFPHLYFSPDHLFNMPTVRGKLRSSRLRELRELRGLSQEALVDAMCNKGLSLSLATLKRAERGRPTLPRTVCALAAFFDVPLSELMEAGGLDSNVEAAPKLGATTRVSSFRRPPIVGREFEIAQFRLALDRVVNQHESCLFLIRGIAGIGKTRLLQEFIRIACKTDVLGVTARVLQDGGKSWYCPLQVVLAELVREITSKNGELHNLVEILCDNEGFTPAQHSHLLTMLGLSTHPATSVSLAAMGYMERRAEEIDVFVALLGRVKRPVVFAIEDLHWASESQLLAIRDVAGRLSGQSVVMVVTTRGQDAGEAALWSSLLNIPILGCTLTPLGKHESCAIAARYLESDAEHRKRCVEQARGHPLFLEQLLLSGRSDDEALPISFKNFIIQKLDSLREIDRRAASIAAYSYDDTFDANMIASCLGEETYDASPLEHEAMVVGIGNGCYRFVHSLIRQGVVSVIHDPRTVCQIHYGLAQWFRKRDEVKYAQHLRAANHRDAPKVILETTLGSATRHREDDALNLLSAALELDLSIEQRRSLLAMKGQILQRLQRPERSIRYLQEAFYESDAISERVRLAIELAQAHLSCNRPIEAENVIQKISQICGSGHDFGSMSDVFASRTKKSWCPNEFVREISACSRDGIRVGVLHSQTGILKELELGVMQATLFAMEEINKQGGLIGKPLVPVLADGCSDPLVFAQAAQELIENGNVDAIFGCSTSSSRRRVKPIVEANNSLLIYPYQHEGLECSSNIAYMGPAPNQQVEPAVEYLANECGTRRVFLLGSDYVYPRVMNQLLREACDAKRIEVSGESYVPLGGVDFGAAIEGIRASRCDTLLLTVVGLESNKAILRELHQSDVSANNLALASFVLAENDLAEIPVDYTKGVLSVFSYFEDVENVVNRDFVCRFKGRFGSNSRIGGYMESAYIGVWLWAKSVQHGGTSNPVDVRVSLPEITHYAPSGEELRVDPNTNHLARHVRVARVGEDGEFHTLWRSPQPVEPMPYPSSRSIDEWDAWVHGLRKGWQNRWEKRES